MMQFILVYICSVLLIAKGSYTKEHIRAKFEEDFHSRCDKHPFVQRYINNLENPVDRYIIFVYHEKNFRNGGIGDRFGGLVSAVAMAQRFNRTLLIKASNGFHESFRPYHPTDIKSENPKYLWNKWGTWSKYKAVSDRITAIDDDDELDEIEYDQEDCVSNAEEGFTDEQTYKCSMDDGDVPQQVIKFKSNRAYLCRWLNHPEYKSHKEFQRVLHTPLSGANREQAALTTTAISTKASKKSKTPLGFDPEADLFEVAGCMMRLALWPTEALWNNVDKLYEEYRSSLGKQQQAAVTGSVGDKKTIEQSKDVGEETETTSKKKNKGKKSKKSKKSKNNSKKQHRELSEQDTKTDEIVMSNNVTQNTSNNTTLLPLPQPVYQIGLHMRCGDRWSYLNLKLHTDGYDRYACVVEKPDENGFESSKEHEKSIYLNAGTPITIGACGRSVYYEYLEREVKAARKRQRELKQQQTQQIGDASLSIDGNIDDTSQTPTPTTLQPSVAKTPPFALDPARSSFVYITTDNIMSAQQINSTFAHPQSLITPQGCHIELDPSTECHTFTVSYWFMLALSDVLVTQTFGTYSAPTSSFSRYAGIYGLKVDPFRSGRFCEDRFGNAIISHVEQGNWFCK